MLQNIPNGLDEIIATFGSIDDFRFEQKHICVFALPYPLYYGGKKVLQARCHALAADHFMLAFNSILRAGLQDQVKNYSGTYVARSIRGQASHPSTHSWGIAVDLEAEKYPLGSSARFPEAVIEIFRNAGFFYGGDFKSRRDPMHFQLCTGY